MTPSAYRIPLSAPDLTGNEASYLEQVVQSTFVSSVGPFVSRFEEEFAGAVGARGAVACSSGTAAIHLALLAVGVGPGDEVLVSDLTFIASANPVRYCGANVVLVDSEPRTWNLDSALVVDELERRARSGAPMPAAVLPVHLIGHPAALDDLITVCDRFEVPVVEDAAEALGAKWTAGRHAGRAVGTAGTVGCFSFNGNKILTSGGGGMVVSDDEGLLARVRHLSTQARLPGLAYRHDEIGYNYRLTNVSAAVGVAQLERLPHFLGRKREIAARYVTALDDLEGLVPRPAAPWATSSSWLSTFLCSSEVWRDELIDALSGRGMEARPIWLPVSAQPPYRGAKRLGAKVAGDIARRAICLPSSAGMTAGEQAEVVGAVAEFARRHAPTV